MVQKPIVSVHMITYNHEAYIEQAIQGILMQETDFEYDLIISDDCSPDNTPKIVHEIVKNHPKGKRIKYFRHKKNIGIKRNGSFALSKCTGKYIALCEGDDYWTDPYKLQKQVDFLKNNPDCVICFTKSKLVTENGDDLGILIPPVKGEKKIFDLKDLLRGNFIPSRTAIFRSGYLSKFPDFFYDHWCGDWLVHIINAQHGKIGFLNETTAAYRKHDNSLSTSKTNTEKIKNTIQTYESLNKYLNMNYDNLIKKMISKQYAILSIEYSIIHKPIDSVNYLIKSWKISPINKYALFDRIKASIAVFIPSIFKNFRNRIIKKYF